jgi:RHS repeat-associated protein
LITDGQGNTYQTLAYAPFGETLLDITSTNGNYYELRQFGGHHFDQESGMLYMGARYNDTKLSIEISTDDKWYLFPHLSSYNSMGNNPVNFVDHDGKQAVAAMGDPPKNESILSRWVNHLRDLFTINLDLSSPEKIKQSVEVQQAKNQEIQTYAEAIETFNSAAGMIFPVVGSAAEIMANAEAGNNNAALAAVPWLLLDVTTAGRGNTVKSGVKAVTKNAATKTLQTSGHTIKDATVKALGLTKEQVNRAIHALKKEHRLRPNDHFKIMDNGDLVNPNTKKVIDNIYDFVK